jgi:hypothetical protein
MKYLPVLLALLFFQSWGTTAQIIATSNIDEVCKIPSATSRKTVAYVELTSVHPNETEWGLTLLNKLELGPREPLMLLAVNPDNFEITEIFDSCFPVFSPNEIAEVRASRRAWEKIFRLDPEQQQKENLQTFETRLRSSLNKLAEASKTVTLGKRRNVLGAISVDKNRFRDQRSFYRIIIYTDGMIVDPSLKDENLPEGIAAKYPASFSGAEVYVYGVTGRDKDKPIETKEKIFSAFFLSNWALVRSFAPSLPQQRSDIYEPTQIIKGNFEGGGGQGPAAISLRTLKNTSAKEGWLTFLVGTNSFYIPFQGEHTCKEDECRLGANVLENVPSWAAAPYFRKNDRLTLSGKAGGELIGTLQPATKEVFKGGPAEVQYKLTLKSE